jgi:hypothetical protein
MCPKCGHVGKINGIPLRGVVVWCACSGWLAAEVKQENNN